jgi:hypothetical protein
MVSFERLDERHDIRTHNDSAGVFARAKILRIEVDDQRCPVRVFENELNTVFMPRQSDAVNRPGHLARR